jgi:phosphatidylethanolamine-binding protein (PEBP) family uncharacterized protein
VKPHGWTALALAAALFTTGPLSAHDGDHSPDMRVWKDADGLFEIEGSFVLARDGRVQILKHGGTVVWVPLNKLSEADREWVRDRIEAIRRLNSSTSEPEREAETSAPSATTNNESVNPALAVLTVFGFAFTAAVVRKVTKSGRGVAVATALLGTGTISVVGIAQDGKPKPAIQTHFEQFKDKLKFRSDEKWFYVESNGMPDHPMMVGIAAWQQQVPLPQAYSGRNAWQIPLFPKLSDKPVSAKKELFRGAIALAVNGVPIFNPIKNDGRTDTFLAGELDEYGGHCGRGDDYHYHIAPVHLEKVVGKGSPIGYALDGFPLYGFTDADGKEPKDLDEFNGRTEKDGYRYYSTKKYPYVNGGLRGVVTVKDDQIDPQPRAYSPRPALTPLRGAKITGFERDDDKRTVTVKYEQGGKAGSVKYTATAESYRFEFTEPGGKTSTETFKVRDDGKRTPPKKRDDNPPKKDGPPSKKDNPPPKKKDGAGQMPWMAAHFEELDADGDGFLTLDELKIEVVRVFTSFDSNKDVRLSKEEYGENATDVKSPLAGFLKEHAAEFADNDGIITKDGFQKFMAAMFEKADRKKIGKITKADAAQTESQKKDGPPPKKDDAPPPKPKPNGSFSLSSPAFEHNGKMPAEFTGDGDGVSPPLKWSGAPDGTKYYAFQLWHPPKADGDEVKSYWVVTNIPATVTSLEKNSKGIGKDGINDKRRTGYDPMNSKGPGQKEYHFTLYALSAEPKFETDKVTRADLLKAIKDITLAETTLSYTYERKAK